MSGTFVTTTGFQKKILADIKTEYETAFKGVFGADIDLDPSGAFGQLIGLLSKRDADIWNGLDEIYSSRAVTSAFGTSLDNIVMENGITRLPATPTIVYDVILFGTDTTVVNSGSLIKNNLLSYQFSLITTTTIEKEISRYNKIEVQGTVSAGKIYTISIDAINYSYTALSDDTAQSVLIELKLLVEAIGGYIANVNYASGSYYLEISKFTEDFSFSIVSSTTLNLLLVGSAGNFECTTTGYITVPEQSLNTIITSVSGWNSVMNYNIGTVGRDIESDSDLRTRRLISLQQGNATENAIREALLNNVDDVVAVNVISNRDDAVDVEGRPAHSFECVISGGADADIANTIWDKMPAGIASYGNTDYTITDEQGFSQTIYFSRAVSKYIWVKVKRSKYVEETYPVNGDLMIKEAIVNWSLSSYNIAVGKDIIIGRLYTPIYTVPAVKDIVVTIAVTDSPSGTPIYSSSDISLSARQIGVFSIDRITVEDL